MIVDLFDLIVKFISGIDVAYGSISGMLARVQKWLLMLFTGWGGGLTYSDIDAFNGYFNSTDVFAIIAFVIAIIIVVSIFVLILKFVKYLLYYIGGLFRI